MTLAPERPTRLAMNSAPRPRCEDDLTLAALLTAVSCARLLVRYDLDSWGIARDHIEMAEEVTATLVENAVKTTGIVKPHPTYSAAYDNLPLIGVRLRLFVRSLVIEVWDSSPEPPTLDDQVFNGDGRSTLHAHSTNVRWGYYPSPQGGKVVWCELIIIPLEADDTTEIPRVLPHRVPQTPPEPKQPVEPMRDPAVLKRVFDGLQHLHSDQEKE
jgi:hypothetical protein